jgi:hypothetical protein
MRKRARRPSPMRTGGALGAIAASDSPAGSPGPLAGGDVSETSAKRPRLVFPFRKSDVRERPKEREQR